MNKDILFILRVPPPYGGGEIVSEILYNELKNEYSFVLINQKNHSKAKQAKWNIGSIYWGLKYIIEVINSIIYLKPKILYIGLPKTFRAFIRNSIIIHLAYLFKIKIFSEFHGM